MKKILTAINNPKLNEELKKENKFEIIGKDIQYKEAILEILEKNNNIDLIILSEKIPGEIELEKLIKKIKLINKKIKLIFILEKENNYLEKILIKNNIIDFYYNNKINLNELIKIINKKEINMEEEIIKLKKIIEEKNKNNKSIKNKKYINCFYNIKEKLKNKMIKNICINKIIKNKEKNKENKNNISKIITFSGNYKSGKTTMSIIVSKLLSEKDNKVLLIDGDLEKNDLSIILKKRSRNKKQNKIKNKISKNNKKYKFKNNKKINLKNNINNILFFKINKNLYFLNKINFVIKKSKNFFEKIKEKYNYIIVDLSKSNSDIINKEIFKNSDINFFVLEANLLGINEAKKLISKYEKNLKINSKNFSLILNKNNINSINKNLISKLINFQNKIYKIKEIKKLNNIFNNYFKINYLIKNKNIKKEINKIILNIKNK